MADDVTGRCMVVQKLIMLGERKGDRVERDERKVYARIGTLARGNVVV